MKDIRLLRSLSIDKRSERRSIGIDIPGGLGNGVEAKEVLEYSGEI
jgi:hypothetical protein